MESASSSSVQIENLMIAANCNTVMKAFAFNRAHKLIAYAAANSILILDPYHINSSVPKVVFSLRGHSERVNGVEWLNENTLVSISADKSLIFWSFTLGSDPKQPESWTQKRVFENAHTESVNYLCAYSPSPNELYILTMCAAGTLKLWLGDSVEHIAFKEQLLFGKNLQEAMSLITYGDKHLMLAIGGYDINVHIYLIPRLQYQSEISKTFKYKFSLLGHQNAIRGFSFTEEIGTSVRYMASCSQDTYIRLWKIQPLENISQSFGGHLDLKQYESKTSFVLRDDEETQVYNITLESVLSSHQDSVSSIQWGLRSSSTDPKQRTLQDYCLLSSAFDFTVCIWKPEEETGVWSVESTLGAMQGNKHAYFGADFLSDDQEILAYTFNGAFHQWKKNAEGRWITQLTVKGHFGEVSDLDWDQHEASLISCSQDQTTRLYSKYGDDKGWFEIGRPQVHGYDLNTIASLKVNSSVNVPSKILSGGDEKVLRLFEAPFSFVKIFNQLNPEAATLNLRFSETKSNQEIESMIGSEVKKQPLGLMNKPVIVLANQNTRVDEEEGGGIGPDFDPNKILSNTKGDELIDDLAEPPVEDVLMSKTLWPEQQKLYGHAFEVFCVASSHKGDCAASSSKAKDKKYADIIIWDLRKGQTSIPCCKLSAHNLTVVQLEFSSCDSFLLSCSRDRSWALFKRTTPDDLQFTLFKKVKDAHSRIIWGISWSHDDALFATASREKQKSIKVWNGLHQEEQIGELHSELPEENPSATALRFFPGLLGQSYGIVVGLETGDLLFWRYNSQEKAWSKIYQVPVFYSHCAAVRRIKFNKHLSDESEGKYVLATCGNDHSVRLLQIKL